MMKIAFVVLIFSLLSDHGSSKPSVEIIEEDLSISEMDMDYGSGLASSLDISGNVGLMSSNMESMAEMAAESALEAEALLSGELHMSGESLLESALNPASIIDNVQSSIYDATSMASNLMDYNGLINDNPFMSLADKAQYLSQLSSFSGERMNMATSLLGMLGGGFISHMQWKLSVIRAAKEHLALAMEALANGDMATVTMEVWEAIHAMEEMCPICQTLKFALQNEDFTMLSFAGNMGLSILSQMESTFDASISD